MPAGRRREGAISTATTEGFRVEVRSRYLEERSDPSRGLWVHAYQVTLTNVGTSPATLRSRHWVITNSHGTEEHVRGAGVVGEEPRLEPGETFRYTSGAPLDTAFGAMHGSYQMERDDGSTFEAEVAPFDLAEPFAMN